MTTRTVQRLAVENGLYYPVDPGAAEQSHIGGNAATNAGGPHAFKYGTTGAWLSGLEAVLADGEVITVGGSQRKDVAGYDLGSLLVGSEGTLAVITSVRLKLIPAVEARHPVVAFYADVDAGCYGIEAAMASGAVPAAIEYLDRECMVIAGAAFPGTVPGEPAMTVIVEADGSRDEAAAGRKALVAALEDTALAIHAPEDKSAVTALWRWREGIGIAVEGRWGGKVSEDICVPLDRLNEALLTTIEIAERHGLDGCSWGHAGDANLHSTFLIDPSDPRQLARAAAAAEDLFALAIRLGGTISGEHGIGLAKAGQLRHQWSAPAVELHRQIKNVFDPGGRLNPGKKTP